MERFRYGTKETIATLCGMACFVLVEWLQMVLAGRGIIPVGLYEYLQLRVLVIAVVAVFFGPLCGVFAGLGGDLLINVLFESSISYSEVLVLGIYGLFMGLYMGRIHLRNGYFTVRDFVDFNAIQIFAGIFCSMFLIPMLLLCVEGIDVYRGVMIGAKSVLGNSIAVGIVVPILMAIAASIRNRGSKARMDGYGT